MDLRFSIEAVIWRGVMFSTCWDVNKNEDGSWGTVYYGDYAPEFDNRRYLTKKEAKRALRRLQQFSGESDWWQSVLESVLIAFIIGAAASLQFIG
jgi:hypothetical protein